MIVSHRHRYVFIEVPQTATTTVARELCKHYGGTAILHKHASYHEFVAQAGQCERNYLVLSGVRHPLDILVSMYEKWRTDHHDYETNPDTEPWQLKRFRWVQAHQASFALTITHFFKPWNVVTPPESALGCVPDHVLRFERLEEDFRDFLRRLDLEPVRSLPVLNRTSRPLEFEPHLRGLEKRCAAVFGPWCAYWGYDISFLNAQVPWWSRAVFSLKMALKRFRRQLKFRTAPVLKSRYRSSG